MKRLRLWATGFLHPATLVAVIALVVSIWSAAETISAGQARPVTFHLGQSLCVSQAGTQGQHLITFPIVMSNPGGQSVAVLAHGAFVDISFSFYDPLVSTHSEATMVGVLEQPSLLELNSAVNSVVPTRIDYRGPQGSVGAVALEPRAATVWSPLFLFEDSELPTQGDIAAARGKNVFGGMSAGDPFGSYTEAHMRGSFVFVHMALTEISGTQSREHFLSGWVDPTQFMLFRNEPESGICVALNKFS